MSDTASVPCGFCGSDVNYNPASHVDICTRCDAYRPQWRSAKGAVLNRGQATLHKLVIWMFVLYTASCWFRLLVLGVSRQDQLWVGVSVFFLTPLSLFMLISNRRLLFGKGRESWYRSF